MANAVSQANLTDNYLSAGLAAQVQSRKSCVLYAAQVDQGYTLKIKGIRKDGDKYVLDIYLMHRYLLVDFPEWGLSAGDVVNLEIEEFGDNNELFGWFQACGRFAFPEGYFDADTRRSMEMWLSAMDDWWSDNPDAERLPWKLLPWVVPGDKGFVFELADWSGGNGYRITNVDFKDSRINGKCFGTMPVTDVQPIEDEGNFDWSKFMGGRRSVPA